jgi:uncharacterized protein (TIGR03086 family)
MSKGESLDELTRAVEQTGTIVAGVRSEQAELPTPCPDWNVRELLDHVVRDIRMFTAQARGEGSGDAAETSGGEGAEGGTFPETYERAAGELVDAWRARGSLDQTAELPFGTVALTWFVGQNTADILVHGWDLARATGQPSELDAELADGSTAWGKENLKPELRGDAFEQEVAVPDDAPPYERLAAVFGRDPSWTPPGGAG